MGYHTTSMQPLRMAIASALLAGALAGCSSSASTMPEAEGHRLGNYGVTALVPSGWHRVALRRLPGARVPLEVASFPAEGAVLTICNPQAIVEQIPAGGALLQILQDSRLTSRHGPGAVSPAGSPGDYKPLPSPFRLGRLQSHECGEAYNVFFRQGGRVFQLRVWTAPGGLSHSVRHQVETLMETLRTKPS